MEFEWDDGKEAINIVKHDLPFSEAQTAFLDKNRIIYLDIKHSSNEKRYFCVGKTVAGGVATVRFTIRNSRIRIFGAGYWREGKKRYDG